MRVSSHIVALAGLTGLGCHSVAQSPTEKATPSATAADASVAPLAASSAPVATPPAAALPPLDWGTRAGLGPLYPIVDGMCIHGTVYALENGAIFAYGMATGPWSRGGNTTAQVIGDTGLVPQADEGLGKAFGFSSPNLIAGRLPDRLFATVDVSSRMVSATDVWIGGARPSDWKLLLASGARFGDAGNAAVQNVPYRELGRVVPLGDGSYAIAELSRLRSGAGEEKESRAFRVIGADGKWVSSPKVPGSDLAALAFGNVFARLGNGEVVGSQEGESKKLVRWSPSRAVSDLPLPVPSKRTMRLVAGKNRAFLDVDGSLYAYEGDAIVPAKVNPRLVPGFSFAVTEDDTLVVGLPSNVLLRETKEGIVTEEPVPQSGTLVGFEKGAPWILAIGKGANGNDALYRKMGKTWEDVPLPAPPFGNELRGPLRVEQLLVQSADDVTVNVRRVEKGYGWKDPEPFRAIYRTKKPNEVLRCQDTRGAGTGIGLHSWAPAADDTCKTAVVVVLPESGKKPSKDYPLLRQRLRGKTELGETLTFVNFEGRGTSNLAVTGLDVAKAKALATLVSTALDLRAEVVCGKPTPTRTFTYDVAKGTFAF